MAGFVPDYLCFAEFSVPCLRRDDARSAYNTGKGICTQVYRHGDRRSSDRYAHYRAHRDDCAAAHANSHSTRRG